MSFFLNLNIPPRLRKSFKFVVLRLLENTFLSQNLFILNLFIFTHVFKQNSPPGSYNYPTCGRKLPIPVEQYFLKIYFSQQKVGRIMGLKNNQNEAYDGIGYKFWYIQPSLQPLHFWFRFYCAIIKIQTC